MSLIQSIRESRPLLRVWLIVDIPAARPVLQLLEQPFPLD